MAAGGTASHTCKPGTAPCKSGRHERSLGCTMLHLATPLQTDGGVAPREFLPEQTNLVRNFLLATSETQNGTLDTRRVPLPHPTSRGEAASSSQNHMLLHGSFERRSQ